VVNWNLDEAAEQTKNFFPFLFRLAAGARERKNCKENFSAGHASKASGGGAERQFRSKKFRARFMDQRGIEPLTFRVQGGRSTIELLALKNLQM
jgi:hypothetical protein